MSYADLFEDARAEFPEIDQDDSQAVLEWLDARPDDVSSVDSLFQLLEVASAELPQINSADINAVLMWADDQEVNDDE